MKEETIQKEYSLKQEKLAQHYLKRYMTELKRHFHLNDESLKKILLKSASLIKTENGIQKFINMLKFKKE